ncbi:MAG: polysaccharide deacetylase family protein [Saprospiraceae bacterium]|nr:polysaccharide deacetylase family protein [Saprospiraceae bacterium]
MTGYWHFLINSVFLLCLGACIYFTAVWWIYMIIIFIHALIMIYGSAYVGSQFYLKTYLKGKQKKEKIISLTFDDGIDQEITTKVLDLLKKYNAPATFFCIGKKLVPATYPILKQMDRDGHLVGNHSFSHSNFFDFYSSARVQKELEDTSQIITNVLNKKPLWFRPPYGVTNPQIGRAARRLGYEGIGWSIRSLDTVIKKTEDLQRRIQKRLHCGAIVLFHDHHEKILDILENFLIYLQKEGYQVVSLEKLLNIKAYQ